MIQCNLKKKKLEICWLKLDILWKSFIFKAMLMSNVYSDEKSQKQNQNIDWKCV